MTLFSGDDRMPSLEEQDIAEKYVLFHPLTRPDTDVKKVLICVAVWLLAVMTACGLLFVAFRAVWVCIVFASAALLLSLRPAAVGCIRLYQHYASEKTRRRCLFRPTCSEYAILAVKKYGAVVGISLSAHRLLHRCRGNIYRIDYP